MNKKFYGKIIGTSFLYNEEVKKNSFSIPSVKYIARDTFYYFIWIMWIIRFIVSWILTNLQSETESNALTSRNLKCGPLNIPRSK